MLFWGCDSVGSKNTQGENTHCVTEFTIESMSETVHEKEPHLSHRRCPSI